VTAEPYAASTPGRSQLLVADEAAGARLEIAAGGDGGRNWCGCQVSPRVSDKRVTLRSVRVSCAERIAQIYWVECVELRGFEPL